MRAGRRAGRRWRKAVTLVELLVVLAIAVVLLSVAIPAVRPALKDKKLREGVRQLNAFLVGAQSRAAALGRPVGVWIERDWRRETLDGYYTAVQIYEAEVPRPYSGDMVFSRALIEPGAVAGVSVAKILKTQASVLDALSDPGDLIRFDYQGPCYEIQAINGTTDPTIWQVAFLHTGPVAYTPATGGLGVPFQIVRKPERRLTAPLELPVGIGIDLSVSGIGPVGRQFCTHSLLVPPAAGPVRWPRSPVIIMFSPDGQIERVYYEQVVTASPLKTALVGQRPLGDIFLLMGRVEQVRANAPTALTAETTDPPPNLFDYSALWVSVGARTGRVINSENASSTVNPAFPSAASVDNVILASRAFARQAQSMGGG